MDQEIFQPFDKTVKQNIQNWLEGSYDEATKNEIRKKLKSDPSCLVNAFYKPLTFGTAGARGIMGIGTNRFNKYTIRSMTQGVANYIKKQNFENPSVVISYDNRNNSHFFAEQTARVLAANGIHAYLFENLRPTPLLSFACRFKRCSAGIMITASHNPPEYNGYKVYWSDGAQVLPPHDVGIINEVENIEDPSQIEIAPITDQHIEKIESELDHVYIEAIRPLQSYKEVNHIDGKNLSIVYTNLHGTGITMIPKALSDWGFSNLHLVTEQMETNGDFPFAKKPNPEEKECLEPGIELMLKEKADVMIATDPDADRMGVVINQKNQAMILSGNELACLLLEHILSSLQEQDKMPQKAAVVKSIVTTELFTKIAAFYEKPTFNVLTGFKYIAEKIRNWETDEENYQFLFGAEESSGFLRGTLVRDKDAISISCIFCEMALKAKLEKKTLYQKLIELYKKHGIHQSETVSISFEEGEKGMQKMEMLMKRLRDTPIDTIGNIKIIHMSDYLTQKSKDLITGKTEKLDLPSSNAISFKLDDMSLITIRPSGTEPKLKIYVEVVEENVDRFDEMLVLCKERLLALVETVKLTLTQ